MRTGWCLGLALLAACGDNGVGAVDGGADARPDVPPGDISAQLAALPGVIVSEWTPPEGFPVEAGYRYFDLQFAMPIDHENPAAGTFELHAALMHKDVAAPLVVYAGGYDLAWARHLTEPAKLVGANQISLEYRFYGASIPAGGVPWSKLRVAQWSADQHAVNALMHTLYSGARIATGGSKGGENALLQHSLFPGDYDGVVAYVPPVITAFPDTRYDGILDRIGVASCRTALRAAARKMLVDHVAMETAALAVGTDTYAVAGIAHATETAIVELEFSFWMTRGEPACGAVPAAGASDAELWTFLDQTSPPAGYSDALLAKAGSQYLYQDHVELGYPTWNYAYLSDLTQYSYEDWSAYLPPGEPHPYDPSGAVALSAWVTSASEHVLLVGGEWDPWGAGYPPVTAGREAFSFLTPHGSHWSSGIYSLAPADQSVALQKLRTWARVSASAPMPAMEVPLASMASRGPR